MPWQGAALTLALATDLAKMGSSGEKIDVLFYAGTARQGKCIFASASEPCFLEHANGAEIVLGDAGTKRPRRLKAKELRQSSGGDTAAPELAPDPVADLRALPLDILAQYEADTAYRRPSMMIPNVVWGCWPASCAM